MNKRILVVGEVNMDIVLSGLAHIPLSEQDVAADDFRVLVGGQGSTIARALSRLGADVAFAGRVGADDYGYRAVRELEADGIDVSGIAIDPELRTGITVILSTGKERAFATYMGSISSVRRGDVTRSMLQHAQHLHLSSFYLHTTLRPELAELLAEAHSLGLTLSMDPGWDTFNRWEPDIFDILRRIDIFLPNEVEAMTITSAETVEQALSVLASHTRTVVIKRGGLGCLARSGSETLARPAFPVQVVDVTSAGDIFNAGYLYGFLSGWDLAKSLNFANACGAIATAKPGSMGLISGVQEVETFLAAQPIR